MLSYLSGLSQGISFQGCATQLFFYHFLGCTECFLYTVMAYDRFVAICFPLRYMVIMNHRVCTSWPQGPGWWLYQYQYLTSLTFQLSYCGSNKVSYYFCDIPAILPLACGDTSLAQRGRFYKCWPFCLSFAFSHSCFHYTRALGLPYQEFAPAEGRKPSILHLQCAHVTAILCAYGPVIIIYLQPNPSALLGAIIQILNNHVTVLNPLIYSLRNQDVKSEECISQEKLHS